MFCVFVIIFFNWKTKYSEKIILISKSRKGYRYTLVSWLDVQGQGRCSRWKVREKHIPGRKKSTKRAAWLGAWEAWVAYGDGLQWRRQEERNGKSTQERVWKAVHIRSLPLPHSRRRFPPRSPRPPGLPPSLEGESGPHFSQDWIGTSHRSETRIWDPVLYATSCLNLINQVVYLLRLELFVFTTEIVIVVTYRCWKV